MDTIKTLAQDLLIMGGGSIAEAVSLAQDAPKEIRRALIAEIKRQGKS